MKNALTVRILIGGAVTLCPSFLPGSQQTLLNISEMPMTDVAVGDAGERIPVRQLKREQRLAGEEEFGPHDF
jgi:hypothetical protein